MEKACTRVHFVAVRRADGQPLVGAEAAAALRDEEAPVVARTRGRPEVEDELAMRLPADHIRAFGPPSECFAAAILEGRRDSAPGPDGIRCAAWNHASPPFWQALEAHAFRTFDGARLPQSDRGATCFAPKALNEEHCVRRDETRPITLLNITFKFTDTMCNTHLSAALHSYIDDRLSRTMFLTLKLLHSLSLFKGQRLPPRSS